VFHSGNPADFGLPDLITKPERGAMKKVIKTFITACVFALGATFMWSASPRAAVGHCGASCSEAGKNCTGGANFRAYIECHNGASLVCGMGTM